MIPLNDPPSCAPEPKLLGRVAIGASKLRSKDPKPVLGKLLGRVVFGASKLKNKPHGTP